MEDDRSFHEPKGSRKKTTTEEGMVTTAGEIGSFWDPASRLPRNTGWMPAPAAPWMRKRAHPPPGSAASSARPESTPRAGRRLVGQGDGVSDVLHEEDVEPIPRWVEPGTPVSEESKEENGFFAPEDVGEVVLEEDDAIGPSPLGSPIGGSSLRALDRNGMGGKRTLPPLSRNSGVSMGSARTPPAPVASGVDASFVSWVRGALEMGNKERASLEARLESYGREISSLSNRVHRAESEALEAKREAQALRSEAASARETAHSVARKALDAVHLAETRSSVGAQDWSVQIKALEQACRRALDTAEESRRMMVDALQNIEQRKYVGREEEEEEEEKERKRDRSVERVGEIAAVAGAAREEARLAREEARMASAAVRDAVEAAIRASEDGAGAIDEAKLASRRIARLERSIQPGTMADRADETAREVESRLQRAERTARDLQERMERLEVSMERSKRDFLDGEQVQKRSKRDFLDAEQVQKMEFLEREQGQKRSKMDFLEREQAQKSPSSPSNHVTFQNSANRRTDPVRGTHLKYPPLENVPGLDPDSEEEKTPIDSAKQPTRHFVFGSSSYDDENLNEEGDSVLVVDELEAKTAQPVLDILDDASDHGRSPPPAKTPGWFPTTPGQQSPSPAVVGRTGAAAVIESFREAVREDIADLRDEVDRIKNLLEPSKDGTQVPAPWLARLRAAVEAQANIETEERNSLREMFTDRLQLVERRLQSNSTASLVARIDYLAYHWLPWALQSSSTELRTALQAKFDSLEKVVRAEIRARLESERRLGDAIVRSVHAARKDTRTLLSASLPALSKKLSSLSTTPEDPISLQTLSNDLDELRESVDRELGHVLERIQNLSNHNKSTESDTLSVQELDRRFRAMEQRLKRLSEEE